MRVTLVGPIYPYRGGIAHYTAMLYRSLCEQGHQILMVSFRRQYPTWLFPGQSDKEPSKTRLEVGETHYWIDSLNPITWLTAFRRIGRYQPDSIILQWWTPFWGPAWFVLGMLNRLFLRRPLIYLCHNVLPHETRWWDSAMARAVLGWGTRFVTQSEEERERLVALLPEAQATIFPLPILDLFAGQQIPKYRAREQLGVATEIPLLLFFGIVREYKGLKDLLRAMPEIKRRLGKVTLLVAGEFWEDQQPYQEMMQELGIVDLVRLDSRYIPNDELGVFFSAADVLVAPYRQVTGSAVLQLARGFGLPVITTHTGGIPEVVGDELGLLVPPGDPEALAAAIVRYFEGDLGPTFRERIDQHRERFSWQQLVAAIEELAQEART